MYLSVVLPYFRANANTAQIAPPAAATNANDPTIMYTTM